MKKLTNIVRLIKLIRKHVEPRHLFDRLDEMATKRIAARIIDDGAIATRDIEEFWKRAAHAVDSSLGECYEFGVFDGTSINFFARELCTEIHGFDSFEGLPSGGGVWTQYVVEKTFDRGGALPTVEDNVRLHKGWIADTLPRFIAANTLRQAAFIHIDTDVYESAACILDNLGPYIKAGTILVFDEFCNYEGFYLHEYQAFMAFATKYKLNYRIFAVCSVGTIYGNFVKVAIKIG